LHISPAGQKPSGSGELGSQLHPGGKHFGGIYLGKFIKILFYNKID